MATTEQEQDGTVKHEDGDKTPALAPTWPLEEQVDPLELRTSPIPKSPKDQAPSPRPVRTYSESSHFAPTRRSSFGQTPGAATRPEQSEHELTARSSFRKSMPLAPSSVNHSLPAGVEKRRKSMPMPSLTTELVDRPHTPSSSDYMQLGGMKFGSLRITNDSPARKAKGTEHSSADPLLGITHAGHIRPTSSTVPKPGVTDLGSDVGNLGLTAQPGTLEIDFSSNNQIETSGTEAKAVAAQGSGHGLTQEPSRINEEAASRRESEPFGNSEIQIESAAAQDSSVEESVPSLGSASSSTDGETAPGVQRVHSLRSRGSAILTSLWPRKSLESGATKSSASSTHSRTTSLPDSRPDEDGAETTSLSQSDGRGSQPNKLKRLLKSKRRSLPPDSTYVVQDTTPMPVDAEDKLREHGFKVVGVPAERPALRMEQSKDTLKTIMSVGSAEHLPEDDDTTPSQDRTRRARSRSSTSEQLSPKPSNVNRTRSLLYPKTSGQRRATLRKSMPVVVKPSSVKGEDDVDLGETVQIWGYEADMSSIASIRHMAGNSAFDQAFVPMSRDYEVSHHAPVRVQPPRHERAAPHGRSGWNHHPLRSRSSAPDFLETVCEPASPGGIDSTQQKPPKTPPPISLRTRGSKKSRRRSRSQHHSYRTRPNYNNAPMPSHPDMSGFANEPEGDLTLPRSLSQSLRSFPVQPPPGHHTNTHGGSHNVYDRSQFPAPRNQSHRSSWNGGPYGGTPGYHRPGSGPYHHSDTSSRTHHSHNTFSHRGPPIRIS